MDNRGDAGANGGDPAENAGFAGVRVDDFGREGVLLGRMGAILRAMPATGREAVVIGWPIGEDGRKRYAGSALFDDAGALLAAARSTWIVPTV